VGQCCVSGRSVSGGAVITGAVCGAVLCLCDAVQFCSERCD
jgi:hypothetical protein